MKVFSIVLALASSLPSVLAMIDEQPDEYEAPDGVCMGAPAECCLGAGGYLTDSTVTNLDFENAQVLQTSTLEEVGGELRYSSVGLFEGAPIDLVVTVNSGDYTNTSATRAERLALSELDPPLYTGSTWWRTGKRKPSSKFGTINFQTVDGQAKSGEGNFKFCFVNQATNDPVTLKQFVFTIFDEDNRGEDKFQSDGKRRNGIGVKEKVVFQTSQASAYQLWPSVEESEIELSCEDNSELPCAADVRTVFHASTKGISGDFPDDPNDLTELQKKRSLGLTFHDTSCFDITFDHYCPVDQLDWVPDGIELSTLALNNQPHENGVLTGCRSYGPGQFDFSGTADEILHQGDCILPPPAPSSCPAPENRKLQIGSTVQGTEAYNPYTNDDVGKGVMKMCVRSSLGYIKSGSTGISTEFQEVNYIESLITIKYDLTAGFCVESFAVEPKLRVETTANKANVYKLRAYLCQLYDGAIEMDDNAANNGYGVEMPKDLTADFVADPNGSVNGGEGGKGKQVGAKAFNQGSLITVCVMPEPEAYEEGIRMNGLTTFDWTRPTPLNTQEAIANSAPSQNFLTSYIHTECTGGKDYCKFSSVLFADFYRSKGTASGEGSAVIQFAARRRLGETEVRMLQEDETASEFGIEVELEVTDDGPGALKTAGGLGRGASIGVSALASIVALLAAAVLA